MSTTSALLRKLYAQIPSESLSTKRAISRDDVRRAIMLTATAKRRVRVYSRDGFVPNAYKWKCQIQYVQANKSENGWQFTVGWTGARRSRGSGALEVVE